MRARCPRSQLALPRENVDTYGKIPSLPGAVRTLTHSRVPVHPQGNMPAWERAGSVPARARRRAGRPRSQAQRARRLRSQVDTRAPRRTPALPGGRPRSQAQRAGRPRSQAHHARRRAGRSRFTRYCWFIRAERARSIGLTHLLRWMHVRAAQIQRKGCPMTCHQTLWYSIPDATARAAQRAFPKGNRYLTLYDTLGPIFTNPDFADL